MPITYAIAIPPGRGHRFDVPIELVRSVARIERGHAELAQLEPASYAADFEGAFIGQDPGSINDGSLLTFLTARSEPVAFPGIYLGQQEVQRVDVDFTAAWQPKEFVIEARDSVAAAWETINGRAVLEGSDGHHEFLAGLRRNWWRVRVITPNNSQMELREMRFYGRSGPEQTRLVIDWQSVRVSEDRLGTSVFNTTPDTIEVQLIYG